MRQELTRKLARFSSAAPILIAGLMLSVTAGAHEFWLQPEIYRPAKGDTVAVHTLIGTEFAGDSLPFIPELVKRFVITGRDGVRPAGAGFAADPAGRVDINQPGLHVIAYENHGTDTETDWPVFEKYLREEGLEHHLPEARQLADSYAGIATEFYRRHAMSLMQVGDVTDVGVPAMGLGFAIMPLENPYLLSPGQKLPVQVLHLGRPAGNIQINVLNKSAGGSVARVRTDNRGMASINLDRPGIWMLNAVTMYRDKTRKYQWLSDWTSLTFAIN